MNDTKRQNEKETPEERRRRMRRKRLIQERRRRRRRRALILRGILVILFVLILVGIGSAVSCGVKQYNQSAKKKIAGNRRHRSRKSLYSWNLWILRMCFICPSKV